MQSAVGMDHGHEQQFGTIEVTGEGRIAARPDTAQVRLGIVIEAKTAREASEQNAKTANKIIAAVRALGVEESAIQTVGLGLEPVYLWDEPNKRNVLVAYRASNVVAVRAAIERAADVYDAGVGAGANEGGGVSFGLQNDRALRNEALAIAASQAHKECQLVAKTLGVALKGPVQVQIQESSGPRLRELGAIRKSDGTPIMAGELEVVERVHVVYRTTLG